MIIPAEFSGDLTRKNTHLQLVHMTFQLASLIMDVKQTLDWIAFLVLLNTDMCPGAI